jgi:hypothetical protein
MGGRHTARGAPVDVSHMRGRHGDRIRTGRNMSRDHMTRLTNAVAAHMVPGTAGP